MVLDAFVYRLTNRDKEQDELGRYQSFCASNAISDRDPDDVCILCNKVARSESSGQPLDSGTDTSTTLVCGHVYHSMCFTFYDFKRGDCPRCRMEMRYGNLADERVGLVDQAGQDQASLFVFYTVSVSDVRHEFADVLAKAKDCADDLLTRRFVKQHSAFADPDGLELVSMAPGDPPFPSWGPETSGEIPYLTTAVPPKTLQTRRRSLLSQSAHDMFEDYGGVPQLDLPPALPIGSRLAFVLASRREEGRTEPDESDMTGTASYDDHDDDDDDSDDDDYTDDDDFTDDISVPAHARGHTRYAQASSDHAGLLKAQIAEMQLLLLGEQTRRREAETALRECREQLAIATQGQTVPTIKTSPHLSPAPPPPPPVVLPLSPSGVKAPSQAFEVLSHSGSVESLLERSGSDGQGRSANGRRLDLEHQAGDTTDSDSFDRDDVAWPAHRNVRVAWPLALEVPAEDDGEGQVAEVRTLAGTLLSPEEVDRWVIDPSAAELEEIEWRAC
mmetsp:Transcript_5773/g.14117  ORF Transcript_5773/g.14117 Transcript_5773/m.14117 type:complete len:502 (-) Transcript_5773:68-1573(-)